ncbi:hypothetical protein D1007_50272 [Hordeum vulgare]|nr:hypothetical protein D1007_50272 [Hordeum vulgare]
MSSVFVFSMWSLVTAVPCQDRVSGAALVAPAKQAQWAAPMMALQERIVEESRRTDKKGSSSSAFAGLLAEMQAMERVAWELNSLLEEIAGKGRGSHRVGGPGVRQRGARRRRGGACRGAIRRVQGVGGRPRAAGATGARRVPPRRGQPGRGCALHGAQCTHDRRVRLRDELLQDEAGHAVVTAARRRGGELTGAGQGSIGAYSLGACLVARAAPAWNPRSRLRATPVRLFLGCMHESCKTPFSSPVAPIWIREGDRLATRAAMPPAASPAAERLPPVAPIWIPREIASPPAPPCLRPPAPPPSASLPSP